MLITISQQTHQTLPEAIQIVEEVKVLCKVPAISVGVLHDGKTIYTGAVGERDVEMDEKPDGDTLYTLCSISKTFVSAALGILVDQGKMKWDDPVGKYLPEFRTMGDHQIPEKATFNDFLRHSSGLADPVVTMLGPNGKVLVPQRDFIGIVNETPTMDSEGEPYFNRTWKYSNVAYGLLTLVIEKLSSTSYADFVQKNILEPLGMHHTAVSMDQVEKNRENVAHPYAKLSDESWHKMDHEWTSDKNSPILGMIGMRSSVNDMLKYCAAVMDANLGDNKKPMGVLSTIQANPLKQMDSILHEYYWSRPHDDQFGNKSNFRLAWMEVVMPSCMTSWGSWNKTLGDVVHTDEDKTFRNEHILGQDSGKRLLYKSVGCGFCGVASVNIFPETRSAVVAFSSGINCGDAADFAASVYIQELFDLKPRIDVLEVAKREVTKRLEDWEKIVEDLNKHRDTSQSERDHSEFTGEYRGFGIIVSVLQDTDNDRMMVCLNGRKEIIQALEYYNVDQYSFWPKSRDDWLKGGWLDWDYYLVGIFSFIRNDAGAVTGFTWVWEEGADPYFFKKQA